jgi:hypothetical protein
VAKGNESIQENFILRADSGCIGVDIGRRVPRSPTSWTLFVLDRNWVGIRFVYLGFCVFEG